MHTDFTRTLRVEQLDCSPRCPEEKNGKCVRDAVVTGHDDISLG